MQTKRNDKKQLTANNYAFLVPVDQAMKPLGLAASLAMNTCQTFFEQLTLKAGFALLFCF